MFSKTSNYAFRALVLLATQERDRFVSIREVANKLDISFHFLTKIFQTLSQHNIVETYRGPRGGVRLSRPPEEISLLDIALCLEGEGFLNDCILGISICSQGLPCPLHEAWFPAKNLLHGKLASITLRELAGQYLNGEIVVASARPDKDQRSQPKKRR
ncbi:MAG: Rrf2 family transcriptional regulator [Calditrichaeota bacterium]|nr:MAG: Rrf2 family transcriptional regulator [Calditrichota bacterium]